MGEQEPTELNSSRQLQEQGKKLIESTETLATNILKSTNPSEIKDLTAEFNLAQSKRNLLRSLKLNDLLDKISNHVYDRITYDSGELSDRDLIEYLKVTQETLDKNLKNSQTAETADAIQLTQQNVNINIDTNLNRESRERVIDVVNSILNKISKERDNTELVDSTDESLHNKETNQGD